MKLLLENWKSYLEEAADPCWDGYKKVGMKKKGAKMVPNCVPLEEEVIEEKDDRCTRIAKRKYDVWPSAYASGAVVRCRAGKIWKGVKEEMDIESLLENTEYEDLLETLQEMELSDEEAEELQTIEKELNKASKMHKGQADRIGDVVKEAKKKKAGTESSKESSLRDWFGRKGAKGSKSGWVDCNAPDGKGGYKACGREDDEKRKKYPACRPTPGACKERGKGKSWGKKAKKENRSMTKNELYRIISEEVENVLRLQESNQEYYEVAALDESEEYCPVCVETMDEAKKKKPCKPSKGKRYAKRVDGKCRSYGQAGKAKDGTDRIQPGTEKAHAYCARSAGIKKCKNPPCANTLSRKKWKCQGKRSVV